MRSLRVMFVSHVSGMFGAGRSLLDLIDGLQIQGVTCFVVVPKPGPLLAALKARDIACHVSPIENWAGVDKSIWQRIKSICALFYRALPITKQAHFWNVDVVHSNTSVTPIGAVVAFFLRKPHVWHIREFGYEDYGLRFDLGNKVTMYVMRKSSAQLVVISSALKEKYLKYFPNQLVKLIYDDIYINYEANKSICDNEDQTTLVITGLLHPNKGQMEAILAVAQLVKSGRNVILKVVGSGNKDYENKLRTAVETEGISEIVQFTGYVKDPIPLVVSAEIVLVCSKSEALGRVTIEGMLCGKPIVGARSGATPELVTDGQNGFLYEQGNWQELARKLEYLLDHPAEARKMGIRGFEWAHVQFSTGEGARRMFHTLMKSKNGSRTGGVIEPTKDDA